MDWSKTSVKPEEYYHLLSALAIKNDCETIKELMRVFTQPIFYLLSFPYISLFCNEVGKYYESYGVPVELINESLFSFADVRTSLKLFSDRYGKTQKNILEIDQGQDDYFKSQLRFKFLGKCNLYDNLGVFFDSEGHIIGNTQYVHFMLQDRTLSRDMSLGEELKRFQRAMERVVVSVSIGMNNFCSSFSPHINQLRSTLFYQDYNTNKHISFFSSEHNGKELSLRILHLTCSMNYLRYVLTKMIPSENIWSMRVRYITLYYAYGSLCRLQQKYPNSSFQPLIDEIYPRMKSPFRNLMMHYGFVNNGNPAINNEYLDLKRTLFGAVESNFDGMDYTELSRMIDEDIIMISDALSSLTLLDTSKRKPLD